MKKILLVIDGAAGLPHELLGGKTAFAVAKTPNLDYFAKNGRQGYMYPIDEKTVPGSDNSLISLFGNDPDECRRGIYEVVGAGLRFTRGDLAFRINFGTIDNLKNRQVIDRRAGRTLTTKEAHELADALNKNIKLPCKFELKSTVQHRGALVFRGGFSDNISPIDPEWVAPGRKGSKFRFSKPYDENDENAKYAANVLNDFVSQAFRILNNHPVNKERVRRGLLPANMLFVRGAGMEVQKLKKYKSWMSINPMPLEIGISKLLGMKVFSFDYPKMKGIDSYANLYDALNKTINFAKKTIKKQHKNFQGCYIQFKEPDVPGHDNKPLEKKHMIEIIDKKFFGFLRKFIQNKDINVVVTCDHSTPCKLKAHSAHPVPVLVYDEKYHDKTSHFSEREAKKGSLGKMYGSEFMKKTGLDN
jgi:2,3-bisphosphoglycerate-independent phosphoglycerate mutase